MLLTACVPPLPATTKEWVEYTTGQGVDHDTGNLKLRNLIVVCGEPGSGTLVGTIVHDAAVDAAADALTGIAVEGASDELEPTPVRLPAGRAATLGVGTPLDTTPAEATVRGEVVRPGRMVRVTLTFARAAAVTTPVPVVSNAGIYANVPVPG